MATPPRPGLATFDQGPAQTFAPRLWHHIQLRQGAVMALGIDHKHFARRIMGKGPAHWHAIVFGAQEGAVFFGMAALRFAPMFPRKIGIAAAVGFERRFIVLQSVDEGQDRRFVGGQTCKTDANGPAP